MDKVKNFLERYCEWVALAVAALFLGWTVWGYVLQKPVSSTVGSTAGVSPGDIGEQVWDLKGKTLQIQTTSTDAPTKSMAPVENYPDAIIRDLKAIPPGIAMDLTHPYTQYPPKIDNGGGQPVDDKTPRTLVVEIPTIPALINLCFSKGHSSIKLPNSTLAIDKNWVDVGGEIPVGLLAASFKKAQIPDLFNPVAVYRVYAIREEKDTSGNWVNQTVMEPLDINPMMPLPVVNAAPADRSAYHAWAEEQTNVVLICEPPFYAVDPGHGSVWYEPGMKDPNEVETQTVNDPFDKNNPLAFKGDPNTLTDEERRIYDKAKAAQAAADARRSRTTGTTPGTPPGAGIPGNGGRGGGAGGAGGGGRHAVPTGSPDGQGNMLQQPDWARGRGSGGRIPQQPYQPGGQYRPPTDNSGNGGSLASTTPLPQGSFSPADRAAAAIAAGLKPDIKVWVHDVTVQAGKTYHYKMRYVISNPVAGTTNLCKDPAAADLAYLTSADSKWSDEINVESDTNFYAIDNKHGIRFDIFKWKLGVWQKTTVQANPGDRVGSTEAAIADPTKTDFDTGWTLVDVRDDPSGNTENKILVLVSDTGAVKQKQISIDSHSDRYHQLLKEVASAAEKTAAR